MVRSIYAGALWALAGSLLAAEFTGGVGRWLPRLAYDPAAAGRMTEVEEEELRTMARRWIQKHQRSQLATSRTAGTEAGRFKPRRVPAGEA